MTSSAYSTIFTALYFFTKLLLAVGQSGLACDFTVVKEKTKVIKSIPIIKRDTTAYFFEYTVSFANNASNYDENEGLSTRFQHNRWFHVHENATMELQLMYDSYFEVLRWLLIYSMKEIEIKLSPDDCLQSLSIDEQDNLTRHFLVHKFQLPNFKMCSAHIGDHDGYGRLVFRCCQPTSDVEMACSDIHEDDLLFKLHVFSIIVTVLIILYVLSKLVFIYSRVEEFDFHPEGLKLDFTKERRPVGAPTSLSIPRKVYDKMESLKISVGTEKSVIKTVKTIRFQIKKNKFCSKGNTSISFIPSIAEGLIHSMSSVKRKIKEWCHCCPCGSCCCSNPCGCSRIEEIIQFLFLLVLYTPSIPLIFLSFKHEQDYKRLCSAYKQRNLECLFYLIDEKDVCILTITAATLYCLCCLVFLIKFCVAKTFLLGLPSWCRYILISVFLLSLALTWGLGLHFIVYSFIRSIVTSAITKNTLDDIAPIILPLLFFVRDKIANVSKRYHSVLETVLKYVEPTINSIRFENEQKAGSRTKNDVPTEEQRGKHENEQKAGITSESDACTEEQRGKHENEQKAGITSESDARTEEQRGKHENEQKAGITSESDARTEEQRGKHENEPKAGITSESDACTEEQRGKHENEQKAGIRTKNVRTEEQTVKIINESDVRTGEQTVKIINESDVRTGEQTVQTIHENDLPRLEQGNIKEASETDTKASKCTESKRLNSDNKKLNTVFTISTGSEMKGQGLDKFTVTYGNLRMLMSHPLAFEELQGQTFLSKKLIMRTANGFKNSVLSIYMHVLLISLMTCIVFLLIFYLFIAYGTVYSYSNEIIGYIAFFLTFLNIIKEQLSDSVSSQKPGITTEDQRCLQAIKDQLTYYGEEFLVKDITLKEKEDTTAERENDFTTVYFNIMKKSDRNCICKTGSYPVEARLRSKNHIQIKKSKKEIKRQMLSSV